MTYCHDVKYEYISIKSVISKSHLPDLDYAFNPYVGCAHGCLYCYARDYVGPKYRDVSERWGEIVYIKENVNRVLRTELRRLRPGVIGVSTITDPYQPIEAETSIVREAIKVMLSYGFHVSIQTKSDLVLRDLDILAQFKRSVDVGITITSLSDYSLMRRLEPKSPSPSRRANALAKLSSEGVETWIFYGPVIPTVNDDEKTIKEIVELVVSTNSKLLIDRLRVRPWMKKTLQNALTEKEVGTIMNKARDPKWWNSITKAVLNLCRKHSIECIPTLAEPEAESKTVKLTRYARLNKQE